MKNKNMYTTLIVVGLLLIAFGVVGMISSYEKPEEPEYDEIQLLVDEASDSSQFVAEVAKEEAIEPSASNDTPKSTDTPNEAPVSSSTPAPSPVVDNTEKAAKIEPMKEEESQVVVDNPQEKQSKKEKGNQFEGYVADCFSDRSRFTVLEWNQGVTSPNGVYAEANKSPDFHIRQKYSSSMDIDYYLEAKYISSPKDDGSIFIKKYQLDRYRKFQSSSHRKVLIAIGIGGVPAQPVAFYLVPVDSIGKDGTITSYELSKFKRSNPQKNFHKYINAYFKTVFK